MRRSIVHVALLGYGSVARKHVYAFNNVVFHFPDYGVEPKVTIVYGRSLEKARLFATNYGIEYYSSNLDEVTSRSDIDVVDIALPNYLHHVAATKALLHGKHVLCEKPLAINSEQAWDMYYKAKDAGVVHGVIYNYRWLPAIILAKQLIDKGIIGKIYGFRGIYYEDYGSKPDVPLTWRYVKRFAGSGTLGDNATHVIDLARYLVGEIVEVCSKAKTFIRERPLPGNRGKGVVDTDDYFTSLVEFNNGTIGVIEASRIATGKRNWLEVEVIGSKGYIRWNLNRLNELKVYVEDSMEGEMKIFVTDEKYPYIKRFWPPNGPLGLVDGFTIAFAEYLKAVIEKKEYRPSFYDGAINCSVIDGMLKSWSSKKCVEIEYV